MDTQPTPSNPVGPGEQPTGMSPEQAAAGSQDQSPRAEMAPVPGSAPQTPPPAAPAKMSADDVAAAIAAVPGPGGPSGVVPTPTVAGDVDVIEPEWVDRAEQVVRAHQGDPYGEEEA